MNKPMILVVEDDKAVRNLIATTLETQGYLYHTAATGEASILEVASNQPDVIILDLGLPDMDGVDVIRKVRTWSNTPIIVVSARSEDKDKIDALDAGADDYLTKPFSVDELLARLRVSLRRVRYDRERLPRDSTVFTNGDLRIDYAAGTVRMGGEERPGFVGLAEADRGVGRVVHGARHGEGCAAGVASARRRRGDSAVALRYHADPVRRSRAPRLAAAFPVAGPAAVR